MNYYITANYNSYQQFDLAAIFKQIEGYDYEDIESYDVKQGVLYLTMKDGFVHEEYEHKVLETDYGYPSDVTLINGNGPVIELTDLLMKKIVKINKKLASMKVKLATLTGETK